MTLANTSLFLLCLALAGTAAAAPQKLDQVAAIVGKNVVTLSELNSRIAEIKSRPDAEKIKLPPDDVLRKQVLDHLITESLQLASANRMGVKISPEQVNAAMTNIAQKNRMTLEQFEAMLVSEGLSPAVMRQRLQREITVQQVQRGVVTQRIKVSDLEIENFLKSADAKFWISPEYHIGHFMIALPPSPSAAEVAEAEAKINAVYEELKNGADFAATAIAKSNAQDALNGGDIGWRKSADLPSLFAELVADMPVGSLSKPARSPAGFHILKLLDKRSDANQVITQSKVRHILVKTSAVVSDEEARAKLNKLRTSILGGADFAKLAKENSEDIGSMLNGGDLGWSSPGMFVPEFEAAIAEAQVGAVSEPFKSQFGWHILQVTERRQEDMTKEVLQRKAANILTSRRFEDELQLWLMELKEDAFIDIKVQ
ncbi:MAG TPA: peptidylprolyl isomerase [Cellvibrionaceae bacterium]|nr:peptidylprolyl isomerase [Cellvibrionaceae bacterium]HMW72086.1 peptidylprolyl isomerase [Cellvibrionaceae bacterium]HNG59315.1 peptidylprolyl isomerase [Cellvibrionaceae bacterium]